MKGLIIKDICLLTARKQALIFLLAIGLLMGITMDGSFVIGYMTMLTTIFLIGTISYDEFDNGYPFLLTLPVTRKSYVQAKYVFCLAGGCGGILVGALFYLISCLLKGQEIEPETFAGMAGFLPIMILIISICLPIQLKYGAERSRMVLALFGGICMAAAVLLSRLFPDEAQITTVLENLGKGTIMAGALLAAIAALAISYMAALRVMNNKQF